MSPTTSSAVLRSWLFQEARRRVGSKAAWGGVLGGVIIGGLMLVISLALLSRLDTLAAAPMPMLMLAGEVSPTLSLVVSAVILLMLFNTAVGSLYSVSSRFLTTDTRSFRMGSLVAGVAAYCGSMFGFVNLVGMVYPFFGYIGFFLMAAILVAWFRQRQGQCSESLSVVTQQGGK